MTIPFRDLGVTLLSLTGLVLLLTQLALSPPGSDLAKLAGFPVISGGVTMLLGLAASRWQIPGRFGTLRARLVLVPVLTALLALANVAFTSLLMFLSSHDLILLGGLLSFSLGMAVYAAFIFSRSTTHTIRELVGAVRQMNAGSMDRRVPVLSNDEVGELAASFNAMAERLEAGFNRQQELESSRKELIQAVSHDLRTPLASIWAMVDGINDVWSPTRLLSNATSVPPRPR